MPIAEKTCWGPEFMWPSDDWVGRPQGWLSRITFTDPEEAITVAATELGVARERIELRPVLMRQQSEVEAKIPGNEFPCWVECTTRARRCEPFWRIELIRDEGEWSV
jgi:hypothetical protein